MSDQSQPFQVLSFSNVRTGQSICCRLWAPQYELRWNEYVGRRLPVWTVRYEVETDRGLEEKVSYGSSWLQALLLGIEYVRRLIPRSEEDEWTSEDGLPSWMVLPHHVPISWGHKVFDKAREAVELVEQAASNAAAKKAPRSN